MTIITFCQKTTEFHLNHHSQILIPLLWPTSLQLLIHCLDGVDKSGLFLCALLLLQKIREEDVVDHAWSILSARDANPDFIAGEKQLKCLMDVVAEWKKKW